MENLSSENESKVYTLVATIIGYALIGDFTPLEQNSIGNWFMLIGQILETNAAFEQMFNDNKVQRQKQKYDNERNGEIDKIIKTVEIMQKEINKIKNDLY